MAEETFRLKPLSILIQTIFDQAMVISICQKMSNELYYFLAYSQKTPFISKIDLKKLKNLNIFVNIMTKGSSGRKL